MPQRTAWISFPTAPYTHSSALCAAEKVLGSKGWRVTTSENGSEAAPSNADVYFGDYDLLPFEDVHPGSSSADSSQRYPQVSSYVIRKSLIRKNYLAHSLHVARVKGASTDGLAKVRRKGDLADASIAPATWTFEATCADDLDELLADDLYDVRQTLEQNEAQNSDVAQRTWFILKPAMADQGMGIRLFDTVEALEAIFEEFEEVSDDDEEEEVEGDGQQLNGNRSTAVVTSQVRQFVIQEYLANPLLVRAPTLGGLHKFHIRAYVVAQANLRVFLYDDMLALFAATPYTRPEGGDDLSCHLTNTSRQDDAQSQNTVHMLSDLLGCRIGGADTTHDNKQIFSQSHLDDIRLGAAATIAEAFHAATIADRVHFQPWPNAWEIFGVDLMVTTTSPAHSMRVWLLEINAQPDFAKSGAALQTKIDRLFERTLEITALGDDGAGSSVDEESGTAIWQPGTSRDQMTLCLDVPMSAGGW